MGVFILLCLAAAVVIASPPGSYSITGSGSNWQVSTGRKANAVAWATWSDSRSVDGWTRLRLEASTSVDASAAMFAAGYLEGFVMQKLIFDCYYNFANGTSLPMTSSMVQLVQSQDNWIHTQVKAQGAADPYWEQLGYFVAQYDGIIAGYNAAASPAEKLTRMQLLAYVLQFEIGDYAAATKAPKTHAVFSTPHGRRKLLGEHCSVIVKLAPENEDILSSHVTWSSFNTMLRTYKHYNLPTGKIQFSSFPGLPMSGDDFFINEHQLVIMETTNEIFNMTLYQYLTGQTIPYWLRVQVANQASSGSEWHKLFAKYNNGGYNNQWIIIDYKQFQSGQTPKPGTLWIGEQVPGFYNSLDMTSWFVSNGYWGSYNVPYIPFIYSISGYPAMYEQFGNSYSWSMCARAQIYRRDHDKVVDLKSLKKLQRYNQWQVDPLSLQDACRGISARCDLNSPWTNNTLNGFDAFGGIDCKVTNAQRVPLMESEAVCGPTYDSQAIFWWSSAWDSVPHRGHPTMYAFDFVPMK